MKNERIDDLHRNGYRIIQDPDKFCFGMDAVLLSGFAKVKKGEHVLDLGTGTGIIPILLEAKTEGAYFEGLEIQSDCVDLARRSVELNEIAGKISIRQGDIKDAASIYEANCFHVATSNPPYMNSGGGLINADAPRAIARHELLCSLEDVIRAACWVLKPKGRFYMVHRPHRLADIFYHMRRLGMEPKTFRLVQPYIDKEPNMVLVEGVKNGNPMIKALPVLVVYQKDGSYTEEIQRIYYGDGKYVE